MGHPAAAGGGPPSHWPPDDGDLLNPLVPRARGTPSKKENQFYFRKPTVADKKGLSHPHEQSVSTKG